MAENKNKQDTFDTQEVEAYVESAKDNESAAATTEAVKENKKAAKTGSKSAAKKANFFVRTWKKLVKFIKDTRGELKKVVWTPKAEVFKSFKLVIATVVAVGLCIAVVDTASSWIINSIAGLIG